MQLSKRLQAVADMVSPGSRVADVGCDHAYTSIYLVENDISPYVIAMDINKGPLERAKANILKYGYESKIETRLSNGMVKLAPGEVDSIVIAGMGGALMVNILSDSMEVMHTADELILQPQSENHKLRQFVQEQGFLIIDENMVMDDGKYYTIMKASKAKLCDKPEKYILCSKEHFHYGRLLLERRHPVLRSYLLWDLGICENILVALEAEKTKKASDRKKEILERIKLARCGLEYFSS